MTENIKWINTQNEKKVEQLMKEIQKWPHLSSLSKPILNILVNRGVETIEQIKKTLDNDIVNQHSPLLLKDADKLVGHLKNAIYNKKHIIVYSDYDCDGACSAIVAVLCLRELGANVDYFINNRFVHGYGITPLGVNDMLKRYPTADVVMTTDNGIVAFDGVNEAINKGLQVLITDHHEPLPDGSLPNADAVVDPKRLDETYPFNGLCGASLIYKIMMYLYYEMGKSLDYVDSMIDVVGMATVGDVMPLVDENRLFVKESIKSINKNPSYPFQALKEAIGKSEIDEGTFGFQFVPMINSIGRLDGEIDKAVDLFLSTDKKEVDELVKYLVNTNVKRKEITSDLEKLAIGMVEEEGVQPVIVLAHEAFHEGIVGLVAGRIKELYHRPTIVLTRNKTGLWKGSGRSIEAFSLIESLHTPEISKTLHHFGGHDMACGLGVEDENLEDFKKKMIELASNTLTPDDFIPKIYVDAYVEPDEVTEQLVEELEMIKPYGSGFLSPKIAVKNFNVKSTFQMGKEKQHIKFSNGSMSLIMWNGTPYYYDELKSPRNLQAIGMPSLNYWNGQTSVQMIVEGQNLKNND